MLRIMQKLDKVCLLSNDENAVRLRRKQHMSGVKREERFHNLPPGVCVNR